MMTLRTTAAALLMTGLLLGGCATGQSSSNTQRTANYWPLDSLAISYADPVAVAPMHDHPFRWLGFVLHPLGVVLDHAVNRPAYALASAFPGLFGFTAEDAGHLAARTEEPTD